MVLTKGTYQIFNTCQVSITCLDRWHRDVYLWHLVPSLSSPPFPFFFSCYQLITLLSCCWVCLYFSSFLFAAIILLLQVSSYFISWNNQVSMIFLYWHHKQMLRYRKLSVVWINCGNVSGSLVNQKMLWEEVVSDCFNNFSVSPTLGRAVETQHL